MDGRKDLDKELERRWRSYLAFYPYWTEVIRDDDRDAKRRRTTRGKTLSLDKPRRTRGDRRPRALLEVQPAPSTYANVLEAIVAGSEPTLAEWAGRFCTEIQAKHILRIAAGDTETAIAADEGISQPAISKSIKAGLKRIKEGLRREGVLTGDEHEGPKVPSSPASE
jgi:hypothetical protein